MNIDDPALREICRQIVAFDIDGDVRALPFVQRLARENGWSIDFAERVIDEYKRFLCLSIAAGHPVAPSDQIDQAWHLHLTYTHSYWDRLCGEIARRPLHHIPSAGGDAEARKYERWYQDTLHGYLRVFGHAPPSDIWPAPEMRFGNAVHPAGSPSPILHRFTAVLIGSGLVGLFIGGAIVLPSVSANAFGLETERIASFVLKTENLIAILVGAALIVGLAAIWLSGVHCPNCRRSRARKIHEVKNWQGETVRRYQCRRCGHQFWVPLIPGTACGCCGGS